MFIIDTPRHLGRVVRPGDADWDAARGTFNLLVDQQPEAIAFPANEHEVAAVVADASERGLRVAPQATGHNPGPLGSLEGTVIVHTSALTGVRIDAEARRVRVGAADALARRDAAALRARPGRAPRLVARRRDRGLLARRRHRLARPPARHADQRRDRDRARHRRRAAGAHRRRARARAVLGPARRRRQLRRRHRAGVRGARRCRELYAGAMFFPVERTADVLHAWTGLLPSLPDELTSWASVIHFPPLPEVPEPVRGRAVRDRDGGVPGLRGRRARAPAAARRARPRARHLRDAPAGRPRRAGDGSPRPAAVPHDARAGRRPDRRPRSRTSPASPGRARRWPCSSSATWAARWRGRRPAPVPGRRCRARSACSASASCPGAGAEPAVAERLEAVSAAVAGRRVGDYPNFVEEPADARGFFDADTWERLQRVKALYDPQRPVPRQPPRPARDPGLPSSGPSITLRPRLREEPVMTPARSTPLRALRAPSSCCSSWPSPPSWCRPPARTARRPCARPRGRAEHLRRAPQPALRHRGGGRPRRRRAPHGLPRPRPGLPGP